MELPWNLVLAIGWPQLLALLVGLQRLLELRIAARNGRWLLSQGAVERGGAHYPAIVGLQILWLLSLGFLVPVAAPLLWPWLALYLLLQGLRVWVMTSLGRYWTTRIYHLPSVPLVRRGPYRWLKHPNYLVVVAEVALLPLCVGAWWIAAVFAPLQLALILWRLRAEAPGLAERRGLPGEPAGR